MRADVVVVGSGQAGVPLATRFAAENKRVLLGRTAGRFGVRAGEVMPGFAL